MVYAAQKQTKKLLLLTRVQGSTWVNLVQLYLLIIDMLKLEKSSIAKFLDINQYSSDVSN